MIESVRARGSAPCYADSQHTELSFSDALLRTIALSRPLERALSDRTNVGVLLPPMVPSVLANLALTLLGRVPVNLNYTASAAIVDYCIAKAEIDTVVTSRAALERIPLRPNAKLIYLEDLRDQVSTGDKITAAALSRAPIGIMQRSFPGLRVDLDDTAAIIFTSGSTGTPKGVELSHRNLLSNTNQIRHHLSFEPGETLLGILPLFHCTGYTLTLWMTTIIGLRSVYHFSPLDYRAVGELCEHYGVTLLLTAPTFARTYLDRCPPEQFATVNKFIFGAEKLKPELARQVQETFGVDPIEGYGCSECSPVIAANAPGRIRLGAAGYALPGTELKTTNPESGEDLEGSEVGLIWARGPQVMKGYLGDPEATAAAVVDGWYCTGDIGRIDVDGFLHILDRFSRFSKIGGEMVGHAGVETAIREAVGVTESEVGVTAVPDAKRGERLVVIHVGLDPKQVVSALGDLDIPKLWIPSASDFVEIDELPVLGTGKADLKRLRELAMERLSG